MFKLELRKRREEENKGLKTIHPRSRDGISKGDIYHLKDDFRSRWIFGHYDNA